METILTALRIIAVYNDLNVNHIVKILLKTDKIVYNRKQYKLKYSKVFFYSDGI